MKSGRFRVNAGHREHVIDEAVLAETKSPVSNAPYLPLNDELNRLSLLQE
jgi:hypothetical protein